MNSIGCLGDHDLLALATGKAAADTVRRHVDSCEPCRLRAEHLRAVLSAVHHVAGELPDLAEAGLTSFANSAETTCPVAEGADTQNTTTDLGPGGPPPLPETIGRYRIIGELDSGGQAVVYRAVHPTLPRDLAIKVAHHSSPIDHSLFKGDAEILCELDHPNLVRVHDLDIHEGRPFVVMEFVRGRHLKQLADESPPSPRQAAAWAADLARALDYTHRRGIVHQDLKPKNILIDESGRPRLIDFGMASWRHAWSDGPASPSGGTVAFMAPEQARGELDRIGASSDIFALGGVLYFLLTGQAPFGGETLQKQWARANKCNFDRAALHAKGVSRVLERVVLKAMEPEPNRRYATAGEMARALDAFLHRPRRMAMQTGALLLAAMAVLGWSLWVRPTAMTKSNALVAQVHGPRADQPKTDPAAAAPLGSQSPRIDSLQVQLRRRSPDDPVGWIGANAFEGRLSQDARIEARLSKPAYCYLIALNPDGSIQLCDPEKPGVEPSAKSVIDYPSDSGLGFGLTDGVGMQAFVLVASAKPLPPFADWSRAMGELPWGPAKIEIVWRYDGRNFESDTTRGVVRALIDVPPLLDATCRALRDGPGVQAIRALAFPVKPKQEPKNE